MIAFMLEKHDFFSIYIISYSICFMCKCVVFFRQRLNWAI